MTRIARTTPNRTDPDGSVSRPTSPVARLRTIRKMIVVANWATCTRVTVASAMGVGTLRLCRNRRFSAAGPMPAGATRVTSEAATCTMTVSLAFKGSDV